MQAGDARSARLVEDNMHNAKLRFVFSGSLLEFIFTFFRQGVALALAFALLSSTAMALQEEVHITMNPRLQAMAAQSSAAVPDSQQTSPATPGQPETLVLPPGTMLALGLTRPLSLRSSSARGTAVYLQITFPVTVGGRMVIPPGAYAQGTIQKVEKNRGANPDLVLEMSSVNLIFSTGYTVPLTGTVSLVHPNARLLQPPVSGTEDQPVEAFAANPESSPTPAMSAVTPPGLPPLPPLPNPSLGHGPRNAMIAIGAIGGAALIGTAIFAVRHRNDVYLDTGTPMEITLSAPLLLDARSINTAVQQYSAQMATKPPDIVQPPKRPKTCYDPGTPGTPDTVIPGSPGTPPTVIPGANGMPDTVIPGSPATPDTVIPGIPGTPAREYPCP